MMSRVSPWMIVVCILTLTPTIGAKEGVLGDLVSAAAAERVGLELEWTTHVQVNPAYGKIAYMAQHIDATRTRTVFDVRYGSRRETISEMDLDPFGLALGVEGAREAANTRVEVLAASGIEATSVETVVPQITLYVLTDQALVHAIDAESGKTVWATPVGKRTNPPTPISVDDEYVVLVNGMHIYCLDTETGRILWERRLFAAPGNGPIISQGMAFVPLLNGMVEAFPLDDPTYATESFKTVGRNYVQPASTDETIAWGNDRGHLNVAFSDRVTTVAYRLEAGKDFLSPAVALGNEYLIATSADGYIHCVHERSGRVEWQVSTGETIEDSPFAVDNEVYAVSLRHNLYRIPVDKATFDMVTPGIRQLISVSPTHLYCKGSNDNLVILSRESGARINTIQLTDVDFWFTNHQTDRVFIGTRTGVIQCLRETGLDYPSYIRDDAMEVAPADDADDDNIFRARRGG